MLPSVLIHCEIPAKKYHLD